MYAIVRTGGHQEKVSVGDEIQVNRLAQKTGDTVQLPAVLLVDGESVTTDTNSLGAIAVSAQVLGHLRGPKIKIMKFKNKTGYRRKQGHRQDLTRLRVTGIEKGV